MLCRGGYRPWDRDGNIFGRIAFNSFEIDGGYVIRVRVTRLNGFVRVLEASNGSNRQFDGAVWRGGTVHVVARDGGGACGPTDGHGMRIVRFFLSMRIPTAKLPAPCKQRYSNYGNQAETEQTQRGMKEFSHSKVRTEFDSRIWLKQFTMRPTKLADGWDSGPPPNHCEQLRLSN